MKKIASRDLAPAINLPERIDQLSSKRQEIIRPILVHMVNRWRGVSDR